VGFVVGFGSGRWMVMVMGLWLLDMYFVMMRIYLLQLHLDQDCHCAFTKKSGFKRLR
jgi:hypothetical protein